MKIRMLIMPLVMAVFAIGCASYNPIVIEQLSQSHQRDSEITEQLCEDFYHGAKALGEGPERAYPWLGRAREVEDLNVVFRKQGAACYEAESRDLSDDHETRALDAFKKTWREAEKAVK
jgi:hypothetical protein